MDDLPLHRRSIEVDSYLEEGTLRVVGRLRDERPSSAVSPLVHDMELRLRVGRLPDLQILDAEARMHAFPHEECPHIAPKFARMRGLSVSRGFSRALREMFAGVSGCTHLLELARVMGPAVFQARATLWVQPQQDADQEVEIQTALNALRGTCHVWAPQGPGQQKLELGWRLGGPEYPVPSVERLSEGA